MKTEILGWITSGTTATDIYDELGNHVGTIYDEANAQLCAAAPFMRDTLERIVSIMEAKAYVSESDVINLAKDALAACEVRKERP